MGKTSRAARAVLALLTTALLLGACGGEEPAETETSPTTGAAGAFEITGTVQAVEIEDGSSEETDSAGPAATGSPAAGATQSPSSPLARLLIEVESINDGPAELCDVGEGDEVTLIVTPNTATEPQTALEDMDNLEGRTVQAEGNAEELAAGDRGGNPAAEEEGASPSPTGGQSTPTPTATGSPGGDNAAEGGDGAEPQDPEAGCNFEVARLVVQAAEEGTGGDTAGTGGGSGSPTPAPAGGNDIGRGDASPTPTGNMSTPGGATPTSGGSGT